MKTNNTDVIKKFQEEVKRTIEENIRQFGSKEFYVEVLPYTYQETTVSDYIEQIKYKVVIPFSMVIKDGVRVPQFLEWLEVELGLEHDMSYEKNGFVHWYGSKTLEFVGSIR